MKVLVNIDVPNLTQGVDFYCAALGLQLNRILDEDVAELKRGESTIYLLRKPAGSDCARGSSQTREYSRHWTPVHIDVVVENIERAMTRAIDAGAVPESRCVEWRGSKCQTFSDPFGNGFCLIEFDRKTYS